MSNKSKHSHFLVSYTLAFWKHMSEHYYKRDWTTMLWALVHTWLVGFVLHECPVQHYNPRGTGGYEIVTMTTLFPVFNKSSTSLRRNCCRFGGVFVAGCTENYHAGNFHCGRLRKLRPNGEFIGFAFLGITSELFGEFAYWFLNYQPSFYYCTAILLSILFHSILFPCISFQILFLWILFLMSAIYIIVFIIFSMYFHMHVLYIIFSCHCLYVYRYIYLSIYFLKVGD